MKARRNSSRGQQALRAATAAVSVNVCESLEQRTLLTSLSFRDPLDLTDLTSAAYLQGEPVIAVDPTDPQRIFVAASQKDSRNGEWGKGLVDDAFGIYGAYSDDGGVTWSRSNNGALLGGGARNSAPEIASDGLPLGCCNPDATFDKFGNLYLTYYAKSGIAVAFSKDGGDTFGGVPDAQEQTGAGQGAPHGETQCTGGQCFELARTDATVR